MELPDRKMNESAPRSAVWEKNGGKCWYCGKQTNLWRDFVIDQFISLAQGGDGRFSNLAPSCRTCHRRKGWHSLEEFRARMGIIEGPKLSNEQIAYLKAQGIALLKLPDYQLWF